MRNAHRRCTRTLPIATVPRDRLESLRGGMLDWYQALGRKRQILQGLQCFRKVSGASLRARQVSRQVSGSDDPRQDLFQLGKKLLPPRLGAAIGLLLIGAEARLLHAQAGATARRG